MVMQESNACRPALGNDFVEDSTECNLFQVKDAGPIQQMTAPMGWTFLQEKGLMGLGTRALIQFTPSECESICLSVFYRGVPIGDNAAVDFQRILRSRPAINRSEVLVAQEIRALSDVMNRSTVGDNQYSNATGNPSAKFKLRSAQTVNLNGRTVLEVDGSFLDIYGNSIKDFRGIYANGGLHATRIQQVFLQARPEEFPRYLRDYKAAINSIQWKGSA
jgi:hypothetical protein